VSGSNARSAEPDVTDAAISSSFRGFGARFTVSDVVDVGGGVQIVQRVILGLFLRSQPVRAGPFSSIPVTPAGRQLRSSTFGRSRSDSRGRDRLKRRRRDPTIKTGSEGRDALPSRTRRDPRRRRRRRERRPLRPATHHSHSFVVTRDAQPSGDMGVIPVITGHVVIGVFAGCVPTVGIPSETSGSLFRYSAFTWVGDGEHHPHRAWVRPTYDQ